MIEYENIPDDELKYYLYDKDIVLELVERIENKSEYIEHLERLLRNTFEHVATANMWCEDILDDSTIDSAIAKDIAGTINKELEGVLDDLTEFAL